MTEQYPTCYFHPDRRAGVVCQRCDKPICPACMTQASVGFHCPDCVRQGRQKVVRGRAAFGGGVTQPFVTYALIAVNVVVFLLQQAGGDVVIQGRVVENKAIVDYGINAHAIADGEWYRIVTGAFLQANILHIAFNMFALWSLGRIAEPLVGRWRFALIYAVALVAGSAGAILLSPNALTVGASGAIYGLFGALVLLFRQRGVDIWRSGLGITILINFAITLTVPNISLGGHAGGFVGGLLATWLFIELPRRTRSPAHATVAVACLVPLFVLVGIMGAAR